MIPDSGLPTSDSGLPTGGLSSDIIVTVPVVSAFVSGLLVAVLVAVILVVVLYRRKKKVDHVRNL